MIPLLSSSKRLLNKIGKTIKGSLKTPCICISILSIFLLTLVCLGSGLLIKSLAGKSGFYLANVFKSTEAADYLDYDFFASLSTDKNLTPESPQFILVKNSVLLASTPPTTFSSQVLGSLVAGYQATESKSVISEYIVEEGDTLSSLSEKFDISLNTILWANQLTANSIIKPGQKLVILPISGTVHIIKSGESISAIAKAHKAKEDSVVSFNKLESKDDIYVGDVLVIPGGTMPVQTKTVSTPVSSGTFIVPVLSPYIITQGAHGYYGNAVDFSHSGYACGKPVIASAGGTVQKTGYDVVAGNYVRILHTNGVVTFYGHLSQILVSAGQSVGVGERIGLIGNTGYTIGATGCHLHFEVRGATNPFAK